MSDQRNKPSRGPSKADKISVTVHLTAEEASRFDEIAERNCRSRAGELLWMVRERIGS